MRRGLTVLATAALALVVLGWLTSGERARRLVAAMVPDRMAAPLLVEGVARRQADCPQEPARRRFVALTFGQSNAANYVHGRHASASGVVNFFDGRCYAGKDPLPGADGKGGSVWSRLGDLLIASGRYDDVVMVGVAVSATEVARWSEGGDQYDRLIGALAEMRAHGLTPTHLLWHQGESDAKLGTTAAEYRRHFLRMLEGVRGAGIVAPVYVAKASYCHGRGSAEVRAAQVSLVDATASVREGPDTDVLVGPAWRYDDCHFSAAGADRHAALWRDALLASARQP
jgi:hypothetical protein